MIAPIEDKRKAIEHWFKDQKFRHVKMSMREVSGLDPIDPNDDYKTKYDLIFDTKNTKSASIVLDISRENYVGFYVKGVVGGLQSGILSIGAITTFLNVVSAGDILYKEPVMNWNSWSKPKLLITRPICVFLIENGFPCGEAFLVVDADYTSRRIRKFEPWT